MRTTMTLLVFGASMMLGSISIKMPQRQAVGLYFTGSLLVGVGIGLGIDGWLGPRRR